MAIDNNGICLTHGNPETPTAFKFSQGQSVVVEWNKERRELKWSILGTDLRYTMAVPNEHIQAPLHFVVAMYDSEVSLI